MTTVCKLLGGTIFVSVGQSLFNSKLATLVTQRLPQLAPGTLEAIGAVELRSKLDPSLIDTVTSCYNDALRDVWWMLLGLTAASLFGTLGVEWRKVTDKVASQGVPPLHQQEPMRELKRDRLPGSQTTSNSTSKANLASLAGAPESPESRV
jgi:hypothetical protein